MKYLAPICFLLLLLITACETSNNYQPPPKIIREPYQANRAAFPTDSYCGELGAGLVVGYTEFPIGSTAPNEYCIFDCRDRVIWNTGNCRVLPDGKCPSGKMFNQMDITCK